MGSILRSLVGRVKRLRPGRLNPTISFVILALALFSGMLAWTPPLRLEARAEDTTATPILEAAPAALTHTPVVEPSSTPTPIPQEWVDNKNQTDGVILGAVVLVLIVVGGTLHGIRRAGR